MRCRTRDEEQAAQSDVAHCTLAPRCGQIGETQHMKEALKRAESGQYHCALLWKKNPVGFLWGAFCATFQVSSLALFKCK
jgi:hypothetical protein